MWSHMDKITHIQLHFSWVQNRVPGSKAYFSTFGPAMSVKFIGRICAVIGSGIKKEYNKDLRCLFVLKSQKVEIIETTG